MGSLSDRSTLISPKGFRKRSIGSVSGETKDSQDSLRLRTLCQQRRRSRIFGKRIQALDIRGLRFTRRLKAGLFPSYTPKRQPSPSRTRRCCSRSSSSDGANVRDVSAKNSWRCWRGEGAYWSSCCQQRTIRDAPFRGPN